MLCIFSCLFTDFFLFLVVSCTVAVESALCFLLRYICSMAWGIDLSDGDIYLVYCSQSLNSRMILPLITGSGIMNQASWWVLSTIGIHVWSCTPVSLLVHLFCHLSFVDILTALFTYDVVPVIYAWCLLCYILKLVLGWLIVCKCSVLRP